MPAPPTWRYAGTHGRPLAFRGGVCAVTDAHVHDYPPSPASAFVETPQGWRDVRPNMPFFDPHPHHGRTCFREGWHLHQEPADVLLRWDDEKGAWRAPHSGS